jgi:ankyrin repeat protein
MNGQLHRVSTWAIVSLLQHGILPNVSKIPPEAISLYMCAMSRDGLAWFSQFVPPEVAQEVPFPLRFADTGCIRVGLEMGLKLSIASIPFIMDHNGVNDCEALLHQRWMEQNDSNPAALQSLLNMAIRRLKQDLVEYLVIEKGAQPNLPDVAGNLPIFCAVESTGNVQSTRTIEFLIQQGANLNSRAADGTQDTPILHAARTGKYKLAHWLVVTHGADCGAKDSQGKSFLLQPGMLNHASEPADESSSLLSQLPVDALADVESPGLPLLISVIRMQPPPDLNRILKCRSDWDLLVRDPSGGAPFLTLLAERTIPNQIIAVENLVKDRCDKATAVVFLPVLAAACAKEVLPTHYLTSFLDFFCELDPKFDVNSQKYSRKRRTALHEVAELRNWQLISRLLDLKADVSMVDDDGCTPLIVLCKPPLPKAPSQQLAVHGLMQFNPFTQYQKLVSLLNGTPVGPVPVPEEKHGNIIFASRSILDARDKTGCEAVLHATQSNCFTLVEQLIEAGAQWTCVGPQKGSLITECLFKPEWLISLLPILHRLPDSQKLIQEALKQRDLSGMTPLDHGCKNGQIKFSSTLLELGADPNAAEVRNLYQRLWILPYHTNDIQISIGS